MARLAAFVLAGVVMVGACDSATATPLPTLPAAPAPLDGWVSIGGIGGVGGQGFASIELQLGAKRTALHATCAGTGTLVVLIGLKGSTDGQRAAGQFQCDSPGVTGFFELKGLALPDRAVVTAIVVDGLAATRPSVYFVSVEQPAPEASLSAEP